MLTRFNWTCDFFNWIFIDLYVSNQTLNKEKRWCIFVTVTLLELAVLQQFSSADHQNLLAELLDLDWSKLFPKIAKHGDREGRALYWIL